MPQSIEWFVSLRRAALGFMLAMVVSVGIVMERVAPGNVLAKIGSMAMAMAASLVVYGTTRDVSEPSATARGSHRQVVLVHAVGAIAGVVLVHAILQRVLLSRLTWLREDPRQLVNDFVAVFGILSVIWGCARRPPLLWPIIVGVGLVATYALTSSHWHLDALPRPWGALRPMSVQSFVVAQVAGVSACVALARARREPTTAAEPAVTHPSEARRVDAYLLLTVVLLMIALVFYR